MAIALNFERVAIHKKVGFVKSLAVNVGLKDGWIMKIGLKVGWIITRHVSL